MEFGVFVGWCVFRFISNKNTATCTQALRRCTRHLCAICIDGVADTNNANRRTELSDGADTRSTNAPLGSDRRFGTARCVDPPSVFSTILIDDYGNDIAPYNRPVRRYCHCKVGYLERTWSSTPTNQLEKRHSSRSFGGMMIRMCSRLASCTNPMSSARLHVQ